MKPETNFYIFDLQDKSKEEIYQESLSLFINNENITIFILNKVKEKGLIIEINTSDRSRWDSETLEYMIIKMNENGINYTIGSDAHSVSEIGHMISETTKKVISINKKL